jgi:predicted ATPase/transcriptional regulator with XRE-family HTH domain
MSVAETYSFGEWLKQRRERLRLTQRELAAMTYCSVPMIKKIEADERHPSPELAELLAASLHIPETERAIFIAAARGERPVDALWHLQDEAVTPVIDLHLTLSLPTPSTPFIGRTHELSDIGQRLSQPNCRLLTLIGPGGAGKTRLALAAAQVQQGAFADGAVFVSLVNLTDTAMIPDMLARSLGLSITGSPDEQVMAFLRRRSLLLVLDNCEQLEGDLRFLSELLAHAPDVKVLATSRERLRLTEEWVYNVPELAEAATLFVEIAQRIKQDFHIEAEHAAVDRICRLVQYLPLGVELAAGWTPLMSCNQIAEYIARDISILAADVRNMPERHRSIQAVFDVSWNLLSESEQNALMRLSVFRGGWLVEQSAVVADANLLLLRRLVDKSLVKVRPDGRYDLHELIRQYALQKLTEAGEVVETYQRHFEAYLALAAELYQQEFTLQGMQVVRRFDAEHDNIRAALNWGLDNEQTEVVLHLFYYVWFYWSRRGYYAEGYHWGQRAVQQAGDVESVHLCIVISSMAAAAFTQGWYAEGEALARRALTMAHHLEDPEALIMALGTYTFTSINIEQALANLHEAIDLLDESGKAPEMRPMLYLGAATWYHSAGRLTEARDYYLKSITLFRELGIEDFITEPLGRLGQLALQEGRLQEAYTLTVESIHASRRTGYDMIFSAWGIARLALIQLYLGEGEAAQRSLAEAMLYFEDEHDLRVKQEALWIMSEIKLAQGDVETAVNAMQESLQIGRTLYDQLQATRKLEGTPDALPMDLLGICPRAALIAAALGQYQRAVTLHSIISALCSQGGQTMIPPLKTRLDEMIQSIRARLSEDDFNTAWDAGQRMTLAETFVYLLT